MSRIHEFIVITLACSKELTVTCIDYPSMVQSISHLHELIRLGFLISSKMFIEEYFVLIVTFDLIWNFAIDSLLCLH